MTCVELPYEPLFDKGEGDPIILLHGFFGNFHVWEKVMDEFASTHRVLIPRIPLFTNPITKERLDDLVDYIDRFIRKNVSSDKKVILMGNSLGGHMALMYAWEQPSRVRKLILAGSSGLFENSFGDAFPQVVDYDFVQGQVKSAVSVLHNISMPTLLVWGIQDTVTPPEVALEFHDHLPNSKVVFLESCGHVPMTEQPDLFIHHVRAFLKMPLTPK